MIQLIFDSQADNPVKNKSINGYYYSQYNTFTNILGFLEPYAKKC
jgi:hypothetical protein